MRIIDGEIKGAFQRRQCIARKPGNIEMHGTRRAGGRFAERSPEEMWNLLERVYAAVELRHRRIERPMINFLIRVSILMSGNVASGINGSGPAA